MKTGRGLVEWLVVSCGVWQVGLGLYFLLLRPALLPEDLRYMSADLAALQAVAPRLQQWLDKVFTVLGGFMTGAGLLTTYLGMRVMSRRPAHLPSVLAATGVATVGLMSAVNF